MKNSIGPIEIQIEDPKRFSLVALLVDRDDFLRDISEARSLIKITKIPYELPEYPDEMKHVVKMYEKGHCTINVVRNIIEKICFDKFLPNIVTYDKLLGSAVVMSELLLKKYNKGRSYFSVIFASMLAGKVADIDFPSTYMIELGNIKDAQLELGNYENKDGLIAIVINRESTTKEVKDVFNHICRYRFRSKKGGDEGWLKETYKDRAPTDDFVIDTMSAIKDTREWYWQNKQGTSAKTIWKNLGGEEANITQKAIENSISRYKKNLNKSV